METRDRYCLTIVVIILDNTFQDIIDVMNNALSPDNEAGWSELQQSQSGSEELLSNAESYAQYLASTISDTNETAVFSRKNFGLCSSLVFYNYMLL